MLLTQPSAKPGRNQRGSRMWHELDDTGGPWCESQSQITQTEIYVIQGISFSGNNIVDLGGSTIQIAPYSPIKFPALLRTYVGDAPASNVTIQNGILDGNSANTPSGAYCLVHKLNCHPAIEISSNKSGVNAAHDVKIQNIKFQNWSYTPIVVQGFNSYPLPYDIYILNNEFLNTGGNVIGISGWDHNLVIRGNVFNNWGAGAVGVIDRHADAIYTYDFTGYPVRPVRHGHFRQHFQQPNHIRRGSWVCYRNYRGRAGWVRNFTFSNNHMNDNGTNYGLTLSGNFYNATVTNMYGLLNALGS